MGRKAIILGVVAVLAWGTAASGGGVDEAFRLRLEGKADEAMTILEAECAADGAPAVAHFEMSRLQCYLMDFTVCLAAIDRAVEMEPGNARYHYFSGIFSLYAVIDAAHHQDEARMKELGRRAMAELEAAVEADPDYAEARYMLVQQMTETAPELGLDVSGREDHVAILEEMDPVWGTRARCWLVDEQGKRELLERLMDEHGDEAPACYQVAEGFLELGDVYKAAKCLDKALALDPDRTYLLLRLGAGYGMKQDWKLAAEAGHRYLGTDPVRPLEAWTWFFLGKVKHQQGDREGGNELIAKAEQLDPHVWKTFMPPAEFLYEAP